jgi:hypothetical protein
MHGGMLVAQNVACRLCITVCFFIASVTIIMLPSHSNIAIGPAPHWSGRRREHSSIVLASIALIPGTNKIVSIASVMLHK